MDKTTIKAFATNSRKELMEDVEYKLSLIGITKEGIADSISSADGIETFSISGSTTYSIYDDDIPKRERLVREVKQKGFENVVEEVAYTWFNRIIAIRYMEVNNYLPTKTRVLSSETLGKNEPDIITEALDIDLNYTDEDKELIFKYKDENKLDELFRFLFIKQCNNLNNILPGLFEKTDDYLELLLNISFTNEDGVIRQLIDTISEEDFGNQVEIIGWLYQFYNTELKDDTFANLKKRIKISKERIPAVTQLFTPDWIVKYMVENSVGRLWLECHPNSELQSQWKYYVDEAEQDQEVELKLAEIRKKSENLRPEDIKVIDPCMGSGHILVYVFDVLMQIYVSEGFTEKDAAKSILKNNIYGLEIDGRAYQLAYFAVLMKARNYNRRILNKKIEPLIFSIKETNELSSNFKDYIISKNDNLKKDLIYIFKTFEDAKEYGSILDFKKCEFDEIINYLDILESDKSDLIVFNYQKEFIVLRNLVSQAKILSNKFDVVITNPPYMGASGMNQKLKDYLKKNYPNSKADLFAVFIERCGEMAKKNGLLAMITQQSFMFLSTFEKLRIELINKNTIIDMAHLGARAFDEIGGEVVQATTFVQRKNFIENYNSTFHRLTEFNSEKSKEEEFFNDNNLFLMHQTNFNRIPGCPIAYWVDDNLIECFNNTKLGEIGDVKQGLATADNSRFLRLWHEVDINNIGFSSKNCQDSKKSGFKWFPYNKGGSYRKWYGNQEYVINFENNGFELDHFEKANVSNREFQFKEAIAWSRISSSKISFRYFPEGFLFDSATCCIFLDSNEYQKYILGILNSNISQFILNCIAPTLNYQAGDISLIPIIFDDNKEELEEIIEKNINICKKDWDDYETSWRFKKHPLIKFNQNNIEKSFNDWVKYKNNNFSILKSNEIKLNVIFSNIYNVAIENNIDDKQVSIIPYDYKSDIKSLISYAIGCMFGRYSLDKNGLIFAGGDFNLNNYNKFIPDDDNIIPVLDTEYFDDDVVGYFINFIKTCFGEENLEENLDFISKALFNNNKTSRKNIRDYFLKNFFNNHKKIYKKRPIYWYFSSGKENGFNCLVYIHRYEPNLVARIRTGYLHKTQKAIEQNISRCDNIINSSNSSTEKNKVTKEKNKLIKQLEETREYDEALAYIANQNITIDLDDGIKYNYGKFQNIEVIKEGKKSKINLLKKI